MKQFLAVFTGTDQCENHKKWEALDPETRQKREAEGMKAWGDWIHKNEKSIVVMGSPLGKTKKIDNGGISQIRNALCGFTVVKAESHEEAAKLFLNHPHFAIFPGESVEIMECLPIPGMTS